MGVAKAKKPEDTELGGAVNKDKYGKNTLGFDVKI